VKIDDALIDKLSELAKLEFVGEQRERIKNDLGRMLEFVQKLKEVDTEGVDPLVYLTEEYGSLREDKAENTLTKEQALYNAPSANSDYFKVPKVLKKGE
jgi:aspartyl-tRNA(Asn)/glutamyl-tRNA(Gln) amidotransferase subunit C